MVSSYNALCSVFIAKSPYIRPIAKVCQCVISTLGSYSEECWSLPARKQVFFAHDVGHYNIGYSAFTDII